MEIIAVIVWTIVIIGVAAILLWANSAYAPAGFKRPIGIFIFVVAGIFLVYVLGGFLVKLLPPFPGG